MLYGNHSFLLKPISVTPVKVTPSGTVHIIQLADAAAKSLSAYLGNSSVAISCGQELCLDVAHENIAAAMKSDNVARRSISHHDIPGVGAISHAEFSLVSLLQSNKLLSDLMASTLPEDKKIGNNLLKVAAALHMITSKHGPFAAAAGH